MARAQLKLLVFLIALGMAGGCVAIAYWIWDNILRREMLVQEDMRSARKNVLAPPDPGAKRFDAAVELIRQNQFAEARDALFKMLQQFPDSPLCAEAKRIIGEMNLDNLYTPNQMAGKRDYIVQPGDSLALIASRNSTTVDSLIRMNGLFGTLLQPGDHLLVVPLEFDVVVDVSAKTVTLLRKDRFFKEYAAFGVSLPPGTRVPADMEIGVKQALVDGRAVAATDPRYIEAEKWLPGSRPGIIFRTVPIARAVVVTEETKTPAPSPADALEAPALADTGIFMAKEDLEELFALVRKGSKLRFVR